MKKLALNLFLACALSGLAFGDPITITDDPMVIGGGARPLGMGRTFAAIADDADALFVNAAGGASLKRPEGMTMFTNLLGDVYYSEFCGSTPTPFGTVGIGYINTGVTGIPSTTEATSDYYDNLLVFNYCSSLARFFEYNQNVYVGGNIKIFNRGFTGAINQSATGYSADFGLKYVASPYLNLGLSRQNILPISMGGVIHTNSGAEEAIAGVTKVAVAVKPSPFNGQLLIGADLDLPSQSSRPTTGHLGLEWKLNQLLTVRTGLDQSVDAAAASQTSWNPTFGLSFGSPRFRIDYAYHPYYNNSGLATTYVSLMIAADPVYAIKGSTD